MRRTKLTEHFAVALAAVVVSFLVAAALDRFFETSALVRAVLLGASIAAVVLVVPRALKRWYLRHRDLREVAREVTVRDAAVGDRLLGVFELTRDDEEFARSPELVRAAVAQGERDLGENDLFHALPPSRHKRAAGLAAIPVAAAATFALTLPEVAGNALARWAMPFAGIERYTFARLDGLDSQWVVPVQELRTVRLDLDEATRTRPGQASIHLDGGTISAPLGADDTYTLELPPLADDERALLVVGDVREMIELMPRERPEIVEAVASVDLPDYLDIEEPETRDVRGGSLVVVEGARVDLDLVASRPIRTAEARVVTGEGEALTSAPHAAAVSGERITPATFDPSMLGADGRAKLHVSWVDELGLEGHADFALGLRTRPDEEPVVALSGAEAESVLLESVALTFDVLSSDDFGVRRAGLEWRRFGRRGELSEEHDGEKVLGAGAPDEDSLQSFATFRPKSMGLEAGVYELRGWAEDAMPGREARSVSTPIRVRVMTPDEHMQWVTRQLERWRMRAVEVRDREMELLAENKTIHAMSNAELDAPETRTRIENQARAERGNRARLQSLVSQGKKLLSEAARNEEFGSNALDDWAEANSKLQEIADARMDSVAKKLQQAARSETSGSPSKPTQGGQQPMASSGSQGEPSDSGDENDAKLASAKPPQGGEQDSSKSKKKSPKIIGQDRGQGGGPANQGQEDEEERPEDAIPPTPTILDGESGVAMDQDGETKEPEEGQQGPAPKAALGLVETTLAPVAQEDEEPTDPNITPGGGPQDEQPSLTKEELAAAIAEQEALLVAFNEVAGEIESVLSALENSTFVKRFKAAARAQTESSNDLDTAVAGGFGSRVAVEDDDIKVVNESVAERRDAELPKLTNLHADMDAYFDRLTGRSSSDAPKFKRVLEEWNDLRPTLLADSLVTEAEGGRPGDARASADFLSDTFDRWGEELVGPG